MWKALGVDAGFFFFPAHMFEGWSHPNIQDCTKQQMQPKWSKLEMLPSRNWPTKHVELTLRNISISPVCHLTYMEICLSMLECIHMYTTNVWVGLRADWTTYSYKYEHVFIYILYIIYYILYIIYYILYIIYYILYIIYYILYIIYYILYIIYYIVYFIYYILYHLYIYIISYIYILLSILWSFLFLLLFPTCQVRVVRF